MNTGGFDIDNYHDGDTTIIGSLSVSGNITIGGASGQSEYLDSGDYNTIVTPGGIAWNTLNVKPGTSARYAKNGNIVQFYATLRGNIKANQPSAVLTLTVPAFDLFSVLPLSFGTLSSTFVLSDGSVFNGSVSSITTTGNITSIILFYIRSSGSNITTSQDFDITLTYKLVGVDVPASALLVGGSGGGGGGAVQNPMLNNLDGGGFNLTNFGDIAATTFNGGVILTNPLLVDFNAAGYSVYNVALLSVDNIESNGGVPVIFNNSIDFKSGSSIVGCIDIRTNSIGLNDAKEITINGDVSLSGNNFLGCNDIKINSLSVNNNIGGAININSNMNMVGNAVFGASDILTTKIEAEILDITSKLELFGTGVIENALSTRTIDLKASNINSYTNLYPFVNFLSNIDMGNNTITNILSITNIGAISGHTMTGALSMANHAISGVSDLSVFNSITCGSLITPTINGIKYIRSFNDITSTFSGIYVVCAIITLPLSTAFTTTGDTVFIGYDREQSGFIFNNPSVGVGFCFTSTSHNLTFINMRISNISPTLSLFSLNDPTKLKKLTMFNNLFINCKNQTVVTITGYDLVDINQTVFELCNPSIDHLTIIESDKIQISNCTLYKSTAGAFVGTAPLIRLAGVCNLANINGTVINTLGTQDGIRIDNSFNVGSAAIVGNTLLSFGSTGQLINYNQPLHPTLLVSGNSGIANPKAFLALQGDNNSTFTPTVVGQFTRILFGAPEFMVTANNRFVNGVEQFSFIYRGAQPINVVVNGTFFCNHETGGTDDMRLSLFINNDSVVYQSFFLAQGEPQNIGLHQVFPLFFNDVIEFRVRNLTAGTDPKGFRVNTFTATITEI